jgi:hypothetical protein
MMLDPNNPLNYTHWLSHRLAVALRFVDVFTRRPIDASLRVTIPELGWEAVHCATDSTYRFLVTEADILSGTNLAVIVEDPGHIYVNHSDIRLTLPWTGSSSNTRADHLEEHVLWPTRLFQIPTGETALVGRLTSASANPVEDLDVLFSAGVRLFTPTPDEPQVPPVTPYARTNSDGEFLFRLLDVSRDMSGNPDPPAVGVDVRRGGVPEHPVVPPTFVPDPGRVQTLMFVIP